MCGASGCGFPGRLRRRRPMAAFRTFSFALTLLLCVPLVHGQSDVSNVKTINPTFTTIDVPGNWAVTGVRGINTAGGMVGVFALTNESTSHVHSFLLVNSVFS